MNNDYLSMSSDKILTKINKLYDSIIRQFFFFLYKTDRIWGQFKPVIIMVLMLWRVDVLERTVDDRHPDEESDT